MVKIPLESARRGDIIIWKDVNYNIKLIVTSVLGGEIKAKKISEQGKRKWGGTILEISSKSSICNEYATAYSTIVEPGKETIKCKNNETVTIELRKT